MGTTTTSHYTFTGLSPSRTYLFYVKSGLGAGYTPVSSQTVVVTTRAAQAASSASRKDNGIKSANGKKVIGYYAGWTAYSGNRVTQLDGSKLTHINYAFATIGPDLKIALGDPYADIEHLYPNDSPRDPFHGNFNQLLKVKKLYPHLKTLISVGGWSWSGRFSDAARTKASRTAFADSCVKFIVKYGFDGVDIDWEYPVDGGEPDNVRRPADKRNFTYLMQELRRKLNAQGAKDGKSYLLSFAGAAGPGYANNVELNKLQKIVDYINVMTYDFQGTWDSTTGLNAPLYKDPGGGPAAGNVHDAVQMYLNRGVPAGKLMMGVPFYGYRYDNVREANNGLYQTFSGGKVLPYSQIASLFSGKGYTRYVRESSRVPYLYNGSSFISYEDPESIGSKAAFIKKQGLAGAMVWELSQDTADHDLLNALYQGLKSPDSVKDD